MYLNDELYRLTTGQRVFGTAERLATKLTVKFAVWLWRANVMAKLTVLPLLVWGVGYAADKLPLTRPHELELAQTAGALLVIYCAAGVLVNGPRGRRF